MGRRECEGLKAIDKLLQGFGHQIATSLSVISNDLHYFQNLLPAGECERGLRHCREISNLIKELRLLSEPELEMERMTVGDLLMEDVPPAAGRELWFEGDRRRLIAAMKRLFDLLQSRVPVRVSPVADEARCGLSFALPGPAPVREVSRESPLQDILVESCQLESPFLAVLDAILAAHRCQVEVQGGEVRLWFPRATEEVNHE